MKRIFTVLCVCFLLMSVAGCSCKKVKVPEASDGVFDGSTQSFGVDKNVNIETIDKYLNLDNVAYRDMRLLIDSQGYDDLTSTSSGMLTATIEGFKISPLPYIANLWEGMLPPPVLENPIAPSERPPLFNVEWNNDGTIGKIEGNYEESMQVLNEIFPKDKLIFLMCGGGGYAWMTKQILVKLGYDSTKVYNIGGFWAYTGNHKVELVSYYDKNNNGAYEGSYYSFYKADYMSIDKVLKLLTLKGA